MGRSPLTKWSDITNRVSRCVAYSEYFASSCDGACVANTFIRKCTHLSNPYCVSYTYPELNIKDYGCDSSPTFSYVTVSTSATRKNNSTTLSVNAVMVSTNWVTGWRQTFETTTAAHNNSASAASGDSSSGGGGGTNVGAIVGGVIGGLALIGLLCLIAFWFLLRHRRNKTSSGGASARPASRGSHKNSSSGGGSDAGGAPGSGAVSPGGDKPDGPSMLEASQQPPRHELRDLASPHEVSHPDAAAYFDARTGQYHSPHAAVDSKHLGVGSDSPPPPSELEDSSPQHSRGFLDPLTQQHSPPVEMGMPEGKVHELDADGHR
jgi:hypothetical protein